jgi:hypothetical protein
MLQQGLLNERACDNRDQMDRRAITLGTPTTAGVSLLRQGSIPGGIPAFAGMTMEA